MAKLSVRGPRCAYASRRPCEALEPRRLLAAAPAPAGPEFGVNSHTTGSQELFPEAPHAVAADADGDFVVAWSSSGQDGNAWGVYAQRFAADGSRRAGEFRVNQATANSQWYPSVGCAPDGSFVVVWTSALQDGSGDGVYARRYDAAGAPIGDEFRVNTTTADNQRHPTVAVDATGDFVVAWSGFGQEGGAAWDVYGQRFSAAGARLGGEFRVNATAAGNQQFAAVASDDAGNFVITWTTDAQDGSGTAVYARRYSAAGAVQGNEFRVNAFTTGNQQYSRVAVDADGNFVVAWASAGQDGGGRGVYAQRFAAGGEPRGGEFQVNQATAGEQFAPTVAADADGGFVVSWTGADDGNLFGVFARAYDAAGGTRGGEFGVNTFVAGNQVYSAVASAPDGNCVVVWQSDGQDGSLFGIYGQRYAGVDTTPPTADVVDVAPDPRVDTVGSVRLVFSEPVTGVDRTDFTLTRNGGADLLTNSVTAATTDGGLTWTLLNLGPLTAAEGTYLLTLRGGPGVVDFAGNALAADASDQWTVLPPARVVGRAVFYNGSSFDGHDAAAAEADDAAIATDKQALLPGAAAGFANYTSYSRGINGIMIDVAGLGGAAAVVTASDVDCHLADAPGGVVGSSAAPASISVRPGAGADGSDRVTLLWPDGSIVGRWLRVNLLATTATRLALPDVFWFGNLPGETGDEVGRAEVDGADFSATRGAAAGGAADLFSRYDHDRSGRVDVRDLAVVRASLRHPPLDLTPLPVSGAVAARPSRESYRPPAPSDVLADDEATLQ